MKRILMLLLAIIPGAFATLSPQDRAHGHAVRTDPKVDRVNQFFPDKHGAFVVVVNLTKTSITLKSGSDKPRQFKLCEALARGKISEPRPINGRVTYRLFAPYMYRVSDLKLGDWVAIKYSRVDGEDVCDHICIEKRPGGLVPPLPEGAEIIPATGQLPSFRYHEWQNAYWDFEDRGIPYPQKFGIVRYHTAPPPREKK